MLWRHPVLWRICENAVRRTQVVPTVVGGRRARMQRLFYDRHTYFYD